MSHVPGKDIFVEADGSDMYVSIDNLVDKLDRQMLKHKEKNESHRNIGVLKNLDRSNQPETNRTRLYQWTLHRIIIGTAIVPELPGKSYFSQSWNRWFKPECLDLTLHSYLRISVKAESDLGGR